MGVRQTNGSIGELRDRIRYLASQGFRTETAQVLGATGMKLVADEFRKSTDPYGQPWAPLKSRLGKKLGGGKLGPRRAGKPLLDTGRMRNSLAVEETQQGFRLRITARYSVFHQDGTRRIPRRQMLPDRAGGLGPIWVAAFNREARALIRRRIAKAA